MKGSWGSLANLKAASLRPETASSHLYSVVPVGRWHDHGHDHQRD